MRILYTNPGKTESVTHAALYTRVLTDRQDHDRQIRELEEFVGEEYLDASVDRFAILSPRIVTRVAHSTTGFATRSPMGKSMSCVPVGARCHGERKSSTGLKPAGDALQRHVRAACTVIDED